MKRSSRRRRPRRQLAAQLFAQSKEMGTKEEQEEEEAQRQLAPLCIVWPRATHSKRLRISSEPPQQSSPKSFRYCQIARKFLRSHRPQGDTPHPHPHYATPPQNASPDSGPAEAKVAMTGRANEPAS